MICIKPLQTLNRLDLLNQHLLFEEGSPGNNLSGGADKCADTRVGGPDQRPPVFDSPEDGHRQVLMRGACRPEPGIIRQVD